MMTISGVCKSDIMKESEESSVKIEGISELKLELHKPSSMHA